MDNEVADDQESIRSGSSQSRGRGRHHRGPQLSSLSSNSGGRRHRHQGQEIRGTFRFRNPDELLREEPEENGFVDDQRRTRHHNRDHNRQGFYRLRDDTRINADGRRCHRNNPDHHKQELDSIEKEKEMNKLSLLDGIEEMLKKGPAGNQNLPGDAAASSASFEYDQAHVDAKTKKIEDDDEGIDNETAYSGRKYHKSYGRGGHRHRQNYEMDASYKPRPNHGDVEDGGFSERSRREHHNQRHFNRSRHDPQPFESYQSDRSYHGRNHRKHYDNQVQDGGRRKHYYDKQDERTHLIEAKKDENFNGAISKSSRHANQNRNLFVRNKVQPSAPKPIDDDATQRERLTEQLESRDFECMVCYETVRHRDAVWNCTKCFNIFHLNCIGKWARTPTAILEGSGWRCPTCQDIYKTIPSHYYCFCGKVRDPEISRHDTPHSCGNLCKRSRQIKGCLHPCNILCHPGPCPECEIQVMRSCECGKIEMQVRCGKAKCLTCDGTCEKLLNCGAHKCKEGCHPGLCGPCSAVVSQKCYCSKTTRDVPCTIESSNASRFICDQICGRKLACGQHSCELYCHDGNCPPCQLLPIIVTDCPCGKKSISELLNGGNRIKCTDPIPTCKSDCLKGLPCGPADSLHQCYSVCHIGKCPPCPLKMEVRCRCGFLVQNLPCADIENAPPLTCERRCNKKKHCGRHKCLNLCCIDSDHLCELTCNRMLSCGTHRCPELCHKGNCRTCSNVSFEDLYCDCGSQMVMAPVACGTKPPECDQPCTRDHACDHLIQHNCHSDENCPPCTAFTEKWCFGAHEKRSHVACFLKSLSCGRPCGKPLSCGQHVCLKTCHEDACEPEDPNLAICTQPCVKKRTDCDHPCAAPCHQGPCSFDIPCKTLISLSCECGTRTEKVPCADNVRLFKQVSASLLASKMQDIQLGNSVDISDVLGNSSKKNKLGKLDCNEECSIIERNRRLALALQIRNPDLSSNPGPPKYTDFLKEEYKKNGPLVKMVFDKMSELVQLAKQSKQKSRSHSFAPMNRDHRRVVHELAEFFGCETESFDQEPKRNVVITALRDRSYLPSTSLMVVVDRESGMRKAPAPFLGGANSTSKSLDTSSSVDKSSAANEKVIDYFDF